MTIETPPPAARRFNLRLLFGVVTAVAAVMALAGQVGTPWSFTLALLAYGIFLSVIDRIIWPAVVGAVAAGGLWLLMWSAA